MIVEFQKEHINDIAEAQLLAWQKAFKGILSKNLLSRLTVNSFKQHWPSILKDTERRNMVWLNSRQQAVGFVAYGPPADNHEPANFELYGLYVHPEYWRRGIGSRLVEYAIAFIRVKHSPTTIVLWTMRENKVSRRFYERCGFKANGKERVSERYQSLFTEVQYEKKVES